MNSWFKLDTLNKNMKIKKIKSKQRSSGKYIQHDGNIYKMHNKFGRKNMNDDKRYKYQPKKISYVGKGGGDSKYKEG